MRKERKKRGRGGETNKQRQKRGKEKIEGGNEKGGRKEARTEGKKIGRLYSC